MPMAQCRRHFLATSMAKKGENSRVLNANRAQVPTSRFANSFTSSQRDIEALWRKSERGMQIFGKAKISKCTGRERPLFVVTLICLPHCKYLMELK